MSTPEENAREKDLFMKQYFPAFTQYLDVEKLGAKIPNFRYLNNELQKLDSQTSKSTYEHVMSKKKLLLSKNAKQLCRDGIPVRYMRAVLLKMFNVFCTPSEYNNQKLEVLKGRDFSEMGDQIPTFCDKTFEEALPVHYLNDEGVKALKEVLWLLSGVLPKMEYCPALVPLASFLLLFMTKEETYQLLRNIIEADLTPGDMSNIRWHFRYNLNENIRLYLAISCAIIDISKPTVVEQFKVIENYGLPKIRLIQNMCETFFLDYINFIGVLKLVPFFLYEGIKGIYRYAYGLVAICPFKIVKQKSKEEQEAEQKLSLTGTMYLLTDQLALEYDFEKRPEAEVLKLYKETSNKLENWSFFLNTIQDWDLTHRNNSYTSLKIPSKAKDLFPPVEKTQYIPNLFPESKILTGGLLPKVWEIMPQDVKYNEGIILFDKTTSPEGDLNAIYNICEKLEDSMLVLFIIKTTNGEVFGGIMDQAIKLYDDGKFRIPISAYLFSAAPEAKVYKPKDRMHSEIVCFEAGAIRFGNGEDGQAITLDSDLKTGWTQKNSVFGNDICLLKDYTNDGEFTIENLEIYTML